MPHKDQYQVQQRNVAIRKTFEFYLHAGYARMQAYCKTANDYYLSEQRVRDIVAFRD